MTKITQNIYFSSYGEILCINIFVKKVLHKILWHACCSLKNNVSETIFFSLSLQRDQYHHLLPWLLINASSISEFHLKKNILFFFINTLFKILISITRRLRVIPFSTCPWILWFFEIIVQTAVPSCCLALVGGGLRYIHRINELVISNLKNSYHPSIL